MTDAPNMDLFNELMSSAVAICAELKQTTLEPFNLLEAIINDPGAREMCETIDFPFDKLSNIVNENLVNFESPESKTAGNNTTLTISPLVGEILQEALQLTVQYDQSDIGYMGLLKALRDEGDSYCSSALSETLLDVTDEDFDTFLEMEQLFQEPRTKLTQSFYAAANDNGKVLTMADTLKQRIIGQDKAVDTLTQSMKRAFAGLKEANKPVGSYLFAGPTGVGKTEIAQQLSEFLGVGLVRFDMSEYMDEYSAKNLTGASAGLVGYDNGGLLTNAITENPACVLLLDEVEKAHPQVLNTLLQVMDNASLTDSSGVTVDFSNVIMIMTSNIGATDISKPSMGFAETNSSDQNADYSAAINKHLRPEFRNRLDKIVTFDHLSHDHITEIAKIFVKEMNKLPAAEHNNITFAATPRAIEAMVEQSYDKAMGARPLKRFMNENIKDMMADKILHEGVKDKKLVISYSDKKGGFRIDEKPLPKSKQPKQEVVAEQPDSTPTATAKPAASDASAPAPEPGNM